MEISSRALVTQVHGMLFGVFFLLLVFGMVVELCRSSFTSQPSQLSAKGLSLQRFYLVFTAVVGWFAVLTGAYIVYPWYRAIPPATANLANYPQALLKSSPTTAGWHSLGMEWKEHVAWFAVIAITMAACVLIQYGRAIRQHPQMRKAVHGFVVVAFLSAMVAGLFGAMLNKHAPVRGGTIHQLMQERR
ncbi:MAG TPA: hypothetical protein VMF56_03210 [Acidobacteriaceae bacterium]|nr:hypothetical protein [Acidobacteriaceae bacterium]